MITNFKRVLNFALNDFSRNKGISIATIFVLTITIMLVTGLFFFHGIAGYLTSQIQNKIDITAYINDGTQEQDNLDAKDKILKAKKELKFKAKVFSPLKLKSNPGLLTMGRGKRNRLASPIIASFSMEGPPG